MKGLWNNETSNTTSGVSSMFEMEAAAKYNKIASKRKPQ